MSSVCVCLQGVTAPKKRPLKKEVTPAEEFAGRRPPGGTLSRGAHTLHSVINHHQSPQLTEISRNNDQRLARCRGPHAAHQCAAARGFVGGHTLVSRPPPHCRCARLAHTSVTGDWETRPPPRSTAATVAIIRNPASRRRRQRGALRCFVGRLVVLPPATRRRV